MGAYLGYSLYTSCYIDPLKWDTWVLTRAGEGTCPRYYSMCTCTYPCSYSWHIPASMTNCYMELYMYMCTPTYVYMYVDVCSGLILQKYYFSIDLVFGQASYSLPQFWIVQHLLVFLFTCTCTCPHESKIIVSCKSKYNFCVISISHASPCVCIEMCAI